MGFKTWVQRDLCIKLEFKGGTWVSRVLKTQVPCDNNLMWKKIHIENWVFKIWFLVFTRVPLFSFFRPLFFLFLWVPLFFFFLCGLFYSSSFLFQFLQIFFFFKLKYYVAKKSPCQQSKLEPQRLEMLLSSILSNVC